MTKETQRDRELALFHKITDRKEPTWQEVEHRLNRLTRRLTAFGDAQKWVEGERDRKLEDFYKKHENNS